jgi:hypothetical protein
VQAPRHLNPKTLWEFFTVVEYNLIVQALYYAPPPPKKKKAHETRRPEKRTSTLVWRSSVVAVRICCSRRDSACHITCFRATSTLHGKGGR